MQSFVTWFNGYKTYIALAVGALAIVVNHFVPIPVLHLDPANWLTDLYALVPAATIRHALARIEAQGVMVKAAMGLE
jgi:hypothetical protein